MELKITLVATDDGKAIKIAKFLNLPFIITLRIVIDLFNMKKNSREHARKAIEKLNVIGRYSPDIIAHVLLSLTEETK
jgi:predicted nucleic acid-binding protein